MDNSPLGASSEAGCPWTTNEDVDYSKLNKDMNLLKINATIEEMEEIHQRISLDHAVGIKVEYKDCVDLEKKLIKLKTLLEIENN